MTVCEKCGLDAGRGVDSYLKREPMPGAMRIAIVTGVPTEDDFYANKPLSGRLGGVLCELLRQNDIEPDSCYLVPVTCHTAPENGTVTTANIDQSRKALFEDLEWFKPDRILSVGAHSLQALTAEPGKSLKVTDAQGKWTTVHIGNRIVPVMPIQSPGVLLLKYRAFPEFVRTIERFKGEPKNFEKPTSTLITTLDDARDAIEVICRKKFQPTYGGIQLRTYDIETAGFDPKTRELICKGVTCDPDNHFVFTEEVMNTPDIGKLWKRVLDFPELKWGNWNGTNFDQPFVKHKYGIDFPSDLDGMLIHWILDERRGTHGLKVRGRDDFGAEAYEDEVEKYLDKEWGYRFAPRDILYDYQACDTALTWLELDYMLPKMEESSKYWSLYEDHLKAYAKMYREQKDYGILYDRPYLEGLNARWSVEVETLKLELQLIAKSFNWVGKMIGKRNPVEEVFNPGSPQQLCKLLYDHMGLPILDKRTLKELISGEEEDDEYDWTDGSTDKKVIDVIVEKLAKEGKQFEQREEKLHFITTLRRFRRLKSLNGTFVEGTLKRLDTDNRVYPSVHVIGSETGRPSYRDPSMQNIPKRDVEGFNDQGLSSYGEQIRHAIIPAPGYKLISLDYGQLEIRVAAYLSQDKRAIEMLQSDVDYHILTAASIFKIHPKEVTKAQRGVGKTQNFAIIYQQGDEAMSRNLGCSIAEAAEFRKKYNELFPDLIEYVKECSKQVSTQGYVETLFGNRRRFPFIPDFKTRKAFEREAGNSPIQGTAVYICCSAALKIHSMFDPSVMRVMMTVHDEVAMETRADVAQENFETAKYIMEHPDLEDRGVPWKVEGKIKDRWADGLKGAK